jgi:hypothetical protein
MRVAWVTHHVERDLESQWALPGTVGGAEMCDADMIARRPEGVDVFIVQPDAWQQAMAADRVIVTGTDLLTDEAMVALSSMHPLVWVHHQQTPSNARRRLFKSAAPFVTMSSLHGATEAAWSGVSSEICHGWLDPDEVEPHAKNGRALWAARNHPQKGRVNARMWALRHDVPLDEITDAPRADVLAAMSTATYFVFQPNALDACPRTLIEAELAGCEIVTNALAGRREPGGLHEVLLDQPGRFWGWL